MTTISLDNQHYTAGIDTHGAQLTSLFHKARGEEFIWQRDLAYWNESAPNCFPIVGGLKDGVYTYDGKTYAMAKHGVVRYEDFQIKDNGADYCTLVVTANSRTLASYPFLFALEITFRLTEEGLKVSYLTRNEDDKDMPTGLGYHPAFNIDTTHYAHSDYEVVFSRPETLDLYGLVDGLLALKEKKYMQEETHLQLNEHIFDQDALVFKNITSDRLSLQRRGSDWRVTMLTGGAPHLGIWAKPGAPYVCLEPWYTYQDSATVSGDIFEKPGMFVIQPGHTFESFYEIRPMA